MSVATRGQSRLRCCNHVGPHCRKKKLAEEVAPASSFNQLRREPPSMRRSASIVRQRLSAVNPFRLEYQNPLTNVAPKAQTAKPSAVRSQRLCLRPHAVPRCLFKLDDGIDKAVEPASEVVPIFFTDARSNCRSIAPAWSHQNAFFGTGFDVRAIASLVSLAARRRGRAKGVPNFGC